VSQEYRSGGHTGDANPHAKFDNTERVECPSIPGLHLERASTYANMCIFMKLTAIPSSIAICLKKSQYF